MTKKTFIQEKKNAKHTNVWEWEETPEVLAALEQLRKSSEEVENVFQT